MELKIDENALAVRARSDREELGRLFDHFFPRVYTYCRYRCDDDATADDLAARVFERVVRSMERFDPQKAPFAAWLFTIARNVVTDHWRAKPRRRWPSLEAVREIPAREPLPEAQRIACEEEEALLSALESLDARERDILALKFAAQWTNRQIARELGFSESNVGVIVYRAVGKLRERLAGGA